MFLVACVDVNGKQIAGFEDISVGRPKSNGPLSLSLDKLSSITMGRARSLNKLSSK